MEQSGQADIALSHTSSTIFPILVNEYLIFDSFCFCFCFSCSTFTPSANTVGSIFKIYQYLTSSYYLHNYHLVQATVITFSLISLLGIYPLTLYSTQTSRGILSKCKPQRSTGPQLPFGFTSPLVLHHWGKYAACPSLPALVGRSLLLARSPLYGPPCFQQHYQVCSSLTA